VIVHRHEQGSEEWLEARRGVITGSRFRDARDRTAKGAMTAKATLYAQDVARERCGGMAERVFVNSAMRTGAEQEPLARQAYEARSGNLVEEAGFITTDDNLFGVSVDGLVDDDGMIEVKTLVGSGSLFTAIVERDHAAYIDQINGSLWLLGRKWCDLILWAPDLPTGRLTIVRIVRDETPIQALEDDLLAFEKTVSKYEAALRNVISPGSAPIAAATLSAGAAAQVPQAATPGPTAEVSPPAAVAQPPEPPAHPGAMMNMTSINARLTPFSITSGALEDVFGLVRQPAPGPCVYFRASDMPKIMAAGRKVFG